MKYDTYGRVYIGDTEMGNIQSNIDNNEFLIVYQPKINSITNQTTSLEALVRWNHPEKGLVLPSEFIPNLEESDDFDILNTWIFREVVRQQLEWKEQGMKVVPISINVGTKQLKDEDFLNLVLHLYKEQPLDIGDIAIELLERENIVENEELITLLHQLKDVGYDISIDDFGLGKTGVESLRNLPVTAITLDRSIISKIVEPEYQEAVIAIKQYADTLNIQVISEGVETQEEVEMLRMIGCTIIQGCYYYCPLPVEEVKKVLLEQNKVKGKNMCMFCADW